MPGVWAWAEFLSQRGSILGNKKLYLVLVLMVLFATASWADEVTFSTQPVQGCFGGLSGCTPTQTDTILSLTFQGSNGAFAQTNGGDATLNLGTFTLSNTAGLFNPDLYVGTFTTLITFDEPFFISGGQSATFTAPFLGVVTKLAGGALGIDFDCLGCSNQQQFTFANGSTTGSFTLSLQDVILDVGGAFNPEPRTDTEYLVAKVTNATQTAVPEPASLTLLASGLLFGIRGIRKK